jgi:uncharacterized protein (DUF885 family)
MNKLAHHLSMIFTASVVALSSAADSPVARELTTLNEQRDKAAAAALAPINQKYKSALEQLLKKATQAKDTETVAAIQEALADLEAAAAASADAKKVLSKRSLERKLADTKWVGDGKHFFGQMHFQSGGNVAWVKAGSPNVKSSAPYEVGENGVVTMTVSAQLHTLQFAPDMKSFVIGGSTFKPE